MDTAGLRVQELAALGPPVGVVAGANDFQQLYERHWESVFAVAYRVTGNASDAEDVLQSVFLRLMGNRTVIDGARSPEGYLRRSAANAAIDILRRRRSRSETELNGQSPGRESSPVDKERVRSALGRLEPESAEMFVLCYLEGYTYDELAEMFETERGTIASRLFRIRAELRDYLSK
jgi:RNA polymerase sigma-70 factor (ECF subfamily)